MNLLEKILKHMYSDDPAHYAGNISYNNDKGTEGNNRDGSTIISERTIFLFPSQSVRILLSLLSLHKQLAGHPFKQSLIQNNTTDDLNHENPQPGFIDLNCFPPDSMYLQVSSYAGYVINLITKGNTWKAKSLIDIVDKWYQTGTNEIKNAIANEFVLPVTTCMEMQGFKVKNILSPQLLKEYYQQINTIGI